MQKAKPKLPVVLAMALGLAFGAAAAPDASGTALGERMLQEQKHFADCLVYVYDPGLWISYTNGLFFMPQTLAQRQRIEALKAERAQYRVFTNRQEWHGFVAKVLSESGLEADWQKRLLAPYSPTYPYLTPTLERPLQIVDHYTVFKSLPHQDAYIQVGQSIYFVMGLGRSPDDAFRTNALLVKEGTKTFTTDADVRKTVEAFSNVALSGAEKAALAKAVAAFQKKSAALLGQTAGLKDSQEFQDLKLKARPSSPSMEYLLAKAYLEGKGTAKDEQLGMIWMNKAANDGSGEAAAYLERLKKN